MNKTKEVREFSRAGAIGLEIWSAGKIGLTIYLRQSDPPYFWSPEGCAVLFSELIVKGISIIFDDDYNELSIDLCGSEPLVVYKMDNDGKWSKVK
jgi:hypothetical protein